MITGNYTPNIRNRHMYREDNKLRSFEDKYVYSYSPYDISPYLTRQHGMLKSYFVQEVDKRDGGSIFVSHYFYIFMFRFCESIVDKLILKRIR